MKMYNTLPLMQMVERILDSPHEADKWLGELEKFYISNGGHNKRFVNPVLHECMEEFTNAN